MTKESNDPNNWHKDAACKDAEPEWWFPFGQVSGTQSPAAKAKAICETCPVIKQCARTVIESLDTANPIHDGIWAGVRFTNGHSTIRPCDQREAQYVEIAKRGECLDLYQELKPKPRYSIK